MSERSKPNSWDRLKRTPSSSGGKEGALCWIEEKNTTRIRHKLNERGTENQNRCKLVWKAQYNADFSFALKHLEIDEHSRAMDAILFWCETSRY